MKRKKEEEEVKESEEKAEYWAMRESESIPYFDTLCTLDCCR